MQKVVGSNPIARSAYRQTETPRPLTESGAFSIFIAAFKTVPVSIGDCKSPQCGPWAGKGRPPLGQL